MSAADSFPAARIADVHVQDRVCLTGTLRTAETITIGDRCAWRCVFTDGTGELDLVFLGRDGIAGLAEGAWCTVEGTVASRQGQLTLWNPRYQLHPTATIPPDDAAPSAGAGLVPAANAASPEPASPESGGSGLLVSPAGRFRIYLGVAAGVGKTVAMLDEGRRRRDRGTDVVIALVECHGRPVTEERAAGLETVPRQVVTYHGTSFGEMDTAAVLRRHPAVALVDELAHSKVPGSGRNLKRWQDVLELLRAGIDVITTVNIQHLESVADTVETISGTPVHERIPDWVVRRADQVELVDSSPEQLRRRMQHGNIYPADQVEQALTHFFKTDNLAALRQLALRFAADEADEGLRAKLIRDTVGSARPGATEHVLATFTSVRGAEAVIRRAAWLAAAGKADLDVVHLVDEGPSHREPDPDLVALRRLASDAGASWHQLRDAEPVRALLEYALDGKVTQIVIGSSGYGLWRGLISGSIVSRLSREAARARIDVHIVPADSTGRY